MHIWYHRKISMIQHKPFSTRDNITFIFYALATTTTKNMLNTLVTFTCFSSFYIIYLLYFFHLVFFFVFNFTSISTHLPSYRVAHKRVRHNQFTHSLGLFNLCRPKLVGSFFLCYDKHIETLFGFWRWLSLILPKY